MKATKKWVQSLWLICVGCIIIIMLCNYLIDPIHYFRASSGNFYEKDEGMWLNKDYIRYQKAKYYIRHRNEYNSVFFGGSKGMLFNVNYYDYKNADTNTFNMAANWGNVNEYIKLTQFVIKEKNIKLITIQLSLWELNYLDQWFDPVLGKTPACITGESEIVENSKMLVRDIKSCIDYTKSNKDLWMFNDDFKNELDGSVFDYKLFSYRTNRTYTDEMYKNLFYGGNRMEMFVDENVKALKQIKKICDENDVELRIIIGAADIEQISCYEGEEYYDYLRGLSSIGGFWDFSQLCAVNSNFHNYVNYGHYFTGVSDKMIEIMNGEGKIDGFGYYVTAENVEEYIRQRRDRFNGLKTIYERDGKIPELTKEDPSYLLKDYEEAALKEQGTV